MKMKKKHKRSKSDKSLTKNWAVLVIFAIAALVFGATIVSAVIFALRTYFNV